MTMFIRAVAAEDKATVIKQAVAGKRDDTFFPNLANFKELPGTPFAYWVGEGIRGVFKRFPSVEGDGRAVRQGLATANDFRFLRAQWEIDPGKRGAKWFPFAKGGELSPFYASLHLVIHWDEAGKELKAWADPLYNNSGWSRIIKSTNSQFKPGMTWPLRASRFAPQPLPAGCIFSVRGYSVFLPETSLLPGPLSSTASRSTISSRPCSVASVIPNSLSGSYRSSHGQSRLPSRLRLWRFSRGQRGALLGLPTRV